MCRGGITDLVQKVAHTLHEVQLIFDRFQNTARCFGLTVSLKKTEALHQSCPLSKSASALVMAAVISRQILLLGQFHVQYGSC